MNDNVGTCEMKIKSWDFFFMLFYVLMIGRGASVVATFNPNINPAGFVLYVVSILYFANKSKIHNNSSAGVKILFAILLLWSVCQLFFIHRSGGYIFYFLYLLPFVAGYYLIASLGKNIIFYYEKIMVYLSSFSLICWLLCLVFGTSIFTNLPFLFENTYGNSEYSILFYTITEVSTWEYYSGLLRNSGCAWEPGMFACMNIIGITFNIIKNGEKLNLKDKGLLIMILALLSTISTTGYVALLVIIAVFYLFNSNLNFSVKTISLLLVILVGFYVFKFDFISEKINTEQTVQRREVIDLNKYEREETNVTVYRFEGISLDALNLINDPIFGYGADRSNSYIYRTMSSSLLTSNGITKTLAMEGLLLGTCLLFLFLRGSIAICKDLGCKFSLLIFISFTLISVSYNFEDNPIFRALQIYPLVYSSKWFKLG